jgi:dihydroneopterin aldolase
MPEPSIPPDRIIPDRIILEGMRFYGFHGVNPEEKALGQSYLVDLTVELDLSRPALSDRLEDTVSYSHLYRAVRDVVEGDSRNLLEAIAQSVADRVLSDFPVTAVTVCVKKPHPPVRGSVIEHAGVEIYRVRD